LPTFRGSPFVTQLSNFGGKPSNSEGPDELLPHILKSKYHRIIRTMWNVLRVDTTEQDLLVKFDKTGQNGVPAYEITGM